MVANGIGAVTDPSFFTLNNGAKIPGIGLGTWQSDPGVIGPILKAAIQAGYRHLDCATAYGNQKEIGEALQELFKSGEIKREELFVTSKLWVREISPEEVPFAVERVLQDLQLDKLDLYLPEDYQKLELKATWEALESLVAKGKVGSIGVSNFGIKNLREVLSCATILPAVNQVECHPMWQQSELRSFCKTNNIHLSAYAPLGSAGSSFGTTSVLNNPTVTAIAAKLHKTPAQVALRWCLQMGSSALPKTIRAERLRENLDVFGWNIADEDMERIATIEQKRLFSGAFIVNDSTSPYKSIDELWA